MNLGRGILFPPLNLHPKHRHHIPIIHDAVAGLSGVFYHALDSVLDGISNQAVGVYSSKLEEEERVFVKAGTDSVKDCGYVLAHVGIVGAGAVKMNLCHGGEEASSFLGEEGFQVVGKVAFNKVIDVLDF